MRNHEFDEILPSSDRENLSDRRFQSEPDDDGRYRFGTVLVRDSKNPQYSVGVTPEEMVTIVDAIGYTLPLSKPIEIGNSDAEPEFSP